MPDLTAIINIVRGDDADALAILAALKAQPDVLASAIVKLAVDLPEEPQPPAPPEWVPTHAVTPGVDASLRDDAGQIVKMLAAGTPVKVVDTRSVSIGGWTNRARVELEDGLAGNLWWPRLEQVSIGGGDDAPLFWPTEYHVVTQRFGVNPDIYVPLGLPGHEGLDLRAPSGSNLYACMDGTVTLVASGGAYGNQVRIQGTVNGKQLTAVYGHLEQPLVKQGDAVRRGQVIGKADATGNVRPPGAHHLHFGLKVEGVEPQGYKGYSDPSAWLGLK